MKKTIFLILSIASFSLNFPAQTKIQPQPPKPAEIPDEEYRIWSRIWCGGSDSLKVIRDFSGSTKIISDSRKNIGSESGFASSDYLKKMMPGVTDELINDFNAKNGKSYKLERKFDGCKNYVLISRSELASIFSVEPGLDEAWKRFYIKYPGSGGHLEFCRTGLSRDKKQALIFHSYVCGSLCSSGDFFLFVKAGDEWIEKATVNLWIS